MMDFYFFEDEFFFLFGLLTSFGHCFVLNEHHHPFVEHGNVGSGCTDMFSKMGFLFWFVMLDTKHDLYEC